MAIKYYKRLSFENVGEDDSDTIDRTRKGIAREITTPKYSVICSTEGTDLYKRVDQNIISGAVANRNEIIALIRDKYTMTELLRAQLSMSNPYEYLTQSAFLAFLGNDDPGVIKVYE